MNSAPPLQFKVATDDWEFEQIHQLNYRTFVEEIPQHQVNGGNRLVDKFHHENTYFICLSGKQLIGMIAGREKRPFSLDQKLPALDSFLPPERNVCEIRLLAVEKSHRNGQICCGLMALLSQHYIQRGYDMGIISGTTRQLKLYKKLGFVPFGPLLGTGDALFQPMYLTLEAFAQSAQAIMRLQPAPADTAPANFLPGPVAIHPDVRRAFEQEPISHRGRTFLSDFQVTRQLLCDLVRARECQILLGSGTMANDAIAAQLSLLAQPGIILANGEFGERLIDHAARFQLAFESHAVSWGEPFQENALASVLECSRPGWLWAVHCETSTGVLNDLAQLKRICQQRNIKLCLDGISSIGTVPVDLSDVYLASAVSGKGLASFTGLSMVFHHHSLSPAPGKLPRYLDLGFYAASGGVPFTQSSNLLAALQTALRRVVWNGKFNDLAETAAWLRRELRALGFQLVSPDAHASPAVFTVALPAQFRSDDVGRKLETAGTLLSYGSDYLCKRNWIQFCLMGEYQRPALEAAIASLASVARPAG